MSTTHDTEALEAELRDLLARLRPGGSQAFCSQLRAEIEVVHRQLAAAKRTHAHDDEFTDD
jgi:hypothetical protein